MGDEWNDHSGKCWRNNTKFSTLIELDKRYKMVCDMRIPTPGCTVHALCTCKEYSPLYEVTFIVRPAGEMVGSMGSKLAGYMQPFNC